MGLVFTELGHSRGAPLLILKSPGCPSIPPQGVLKSWANSIGFRVGCTMLRRLKGKHGAAMPTKFEFTLQLHSLEPWPAPAVNAQPRPVALHWSRGSQVILDATIRPNHRSWRSENQPTPKSFVRWRQGCQRRWALRHRRTCHVCAVLRPLALSSPHQPPFTRGCVKVTRAARPPPHTAYPCVALQRRAGRFACCVG
jgi:hypothetical protein